MKLKPMMWIIAILWFLVENQFFGWNAMPQSANELLADGIGYILVSLAVIAGRIGVVVNVHNHTNDTVEITSDGMKQRKSVPIK